VPEIYNKVLKIRKKYLQKVSVKSSTLKRPIYMKSYDEKFDGEICKAIVITLKTRGCAWALSEFGGCTVCGYIYDAALKPVPEDLLLRQFSYAVREIERTNRPVILKIFTSGSFFDEEEIPPPVRHKILEIASKIDNVREVVVETRPEFVTSDVLTECTKILGDKILEVAIGLESSNDDIRMTCFNKGFSWKTFLSAAKIIKENYCRLKVYIFLKPPFLTEMEAIKDAIRSTRDAISAGADTISYNLSTIHRGTLLEYLWKRGEYRPPWLWSAILVLQKVSAIVDLEKTKILCDPVAAGKTRGPHNCGSCDRYVVSILRKFSLSQNPEVLENIKFCRCINAWKAFLHAESYSFSQTVNAYETLT